MNNNIANHFVGNRFQVFLQNVGITALLLPIPIAMAEILNWYWAN